MATFRSTQYRRELSWEAGLSGFASSLSTATLGVNLDRRKQGAVQGLPLLARTGMSTARTLPSGHAWEIEGSHPDGIAYPATSFSFRFASVLCDSLLSRLASWSWLSGSPFLAVSLSQKASWRHRLAACRTQSTSPRPSALTASFR